MGAEVQLEKQDKELSDKRHTSMGPESAAAKAKQGIK